MENGILRFSLFFIISCAILGNIQASEVEMCGLVEPQSIPDITQLIIGHEYTYTMNECHKIFLVKTNSLTENQRVKLEISFSQLSSNFQAYPLLMEQTASIPYLTIVNNKTLSYKSHARTKDDSARATRRSYQVVEFTQNGQFEEYFTLYKNLFLTAKNYDTEAITFTLKLSEISENECIYKCNSQHSHCSKTCICDEGYFDVGCDYQLPIFEKPLAAITAQPKTFSYFAIDLHKSQYIIQFDVYATSSNLEYYIHAIEETVILPTDYAYDDKGVYKTGMNKNEYKTHNFTSYLIIGIFNKNKEEQKMTIDFKSSYYYLDGEKKESNTMFVVGIVGGLFGCILVAVGGMEFYIKYNSRPQGIKHVYAVKQKKFSREEIEKFFPNQQELPSESSEEFNFSERTCVICREKLNKDMKFRMLLPCEHTFHSECLERWLKKNTTCPSCNLELNRGFLEKYISDENHDYAKKVVKKYGRLENFDDSIKSNPGDCSDRQARVHKSKFAH